MADNLIGFPKADTQTPTTDSNTTQDPKKIKDALLQQRSQMLEYISDMERYDSDPYFTDQKMITFPSDTLRDAQDRPILLHMTPAEFRDHLKELLENNLMMLKSIDAGVIPANIKIADPQ